MHAGDTQPSLPMDQRGQKDGASHNRKPQLLRGAQLRIVRPDGRGVDYEQGSGRKELLFVVAQMDFCATLAELAHFLIQRQVRTEHAVAQVQQYISQTAHAAAAGADQVHCGARSRPHQQFADLC